MESYPWDSLKAALGKDEEEVEEDHVTSIQPQRAADWAGVLIPSQTVRESLPLRLPETMDWSQLTPLRRERLQLRNAVAYWSGLVQRCGS